MKTCPVCDEGKLGSPCVFQVCDWCGSEVASPETVNTNHIIHKLENQIKELKLKLKKYASHTQYCHYHFGHDCNCGLDDITKDEG